MTLTASSKVLETDLPIITAANDYECLSWDEINQKWSKTECQVKTKSTTHVTC
jgi:hypothetical protein